jgi:Domain of unknown function (DUF4350)
VKRSTVIVLGAVAAVGATIVALALTAPSAGPSALSASSSGWLAARLYLKAQGHATALIGRPLAEAELPPTLVLCWPASRPLDSGDTDAVKRYLVRGGRLILAYSGRSPGADESLLWKDLGLKAESVRGAPPLNPVGWRRFVDEAWTLSPQPQAGSATARLIVGAPRVVPAPTESSRVLFRGRGGAGVIFEFPRFRGQVFVLPADALSNARLSESGNADLLASLAQWAGGTWGFDEYHHGLLERDEAGSRVASGLDLLIVQLVLCYLLAVLAVGRRFGSPWREMPVVAASTASFLLGLGSIHERLGHQQEARDRLWTRARELDPRLFAPRALFASFAKEPDSLLDDARLVAQWQQKRRPF